MTSIAHRFLTIFLVGTMVLLTSFCPCAMASQAAMRSNKVTACCMNKAHDGKVPVGDQNHTPCKLCCSSRSVDAIPPVQIDVYIAHLDLFAFSPMLAYFTAAPAFNLQCVHVITTAVDSPTSLLRLHCALLI